MEKGSLTPAEWHARFLLQAGWTASLRQYLFTRISIAQAERILEVGSGTGALCDTLERETQAHLYGVDLDAAFLTFARSQGSVRLTRADGGRLPFPAATMDVCLCHYFLLWARDPLQALKEMKRVTRQGGYVLALAEPDYGGRIDYPVELADLGRLQTESLAQKGADPQIGRSLARLFLQAGLQKVETGVLGGQWQHPSADQGFRSEWVQIENDLQGKVAPERLQALKTNDLLARQKGERVLFIPTFYALGQV